MWQSTFYGSRKNSLGCECMVYGADASAARENDPAAPVMSLSFAEVTNKENRKLLQKYLKYGIGIANLSISSLRTEFLVVRKFLGDMNQVETENICMVTEQQMDAWLRSEQQREVQADTFNKKVMCILHFFQYLQIKDYITAIPFDPNYYLKKPSCNIMTEVLRRKPWIRFDGIYIDFQRK